MADSGRCSDGSDDSRWSWVWLVDSDGSPCGVVCDGVLGRISGSDVDAVEIICVSSCRDLFIPDTTPCLAFSNPLKSFSFFFPSAIDNAAVSLFPLLILIKHSRVPDNMRLKVPLDTALVVGVVGIDMVSLCFKACISIDGRGAV